jgi:RimJ/RimL family protein N-acetyltransferase
MKIICETERLIIRTLTLNDATFIVQLLNEESFIRCIGDKNVRSIADANNYLNNGPISSYKHYDFGLNLVLLKETETPIGMCGLLKRPELNHPDLGYALLPEFWGKGFAIEAAKAILEEEVVTHTTNKILAITSPDNSSSNRLLKKVGFSFKETIELYGLQNNLYEYHV